MSEMIEPPPAACTPATLKLTRQQILAADDHRREPLDVPEWGGTVYVRTLTGNEIDRLQATMQQTNGKSRRQNLDNFRARLAIATVCDENGGDLFQVGDVAALALKSAKPLTRVFNLAIKLNGISEDDVEELTKNSDSVPS